MANVLDPYPKLKNDPANDPNFKSGGGDDNKVPQPDPNWVPDTSNSQHGDPWDNLKGSDPPFPKPPLVPGGNDTPGKGVVAVNVDAVKYYAMAIRSMLPVLDGIVKELDDLQPFGAGHFAAGHNFRAKVFGNDDKSSGSTLLASTRQVFVEAQSVIREVSARCDDIVRKYKSADDLGKMDADDFRQMVSGVSNRVDALSLGAAS